MFYSSACLPRAEFWYFQIKLNTNLVRNFLSDSFISNWASSNKMDLIRIHQFVCLSINNQKLNISQFLSLDLKATLTFLIMGLLCLAKHLSNYRSKKPTFWTLLGIEFELLTVSTLTAFFEATLPAQSLLRGLRSLWASYSLCSVIGSVNLKYVNRPISHFQHSIWKNEQTQEYT